MAGRDRSNLVRGAHADELAKRGLSKDEVTDLINAAVVPDTTPQVIGGVPQPVVNPNPPGYAFANRIGPDGKFYASCAYANIGATMRRFWVTHKLRRPDGLYGELRRQSVKVLAEHVANNRAEVEISHGWLPNRTVDLVLIEAKHSVAITDDGGNFDQNPSAATYVDLDAPSGSQPPLASFNTGAGVVGPQVDNELYNTKFRFECLVYTRPNASVDNPSGTATAGNCLAMYRFPTVGAQLGGDNARFVTPVVANENFWDQSTPGYTPCVQLGSILPDRDLCGRTQQSPWEAGEPFCVAGLFRLVGVWSFTDTQSTLEAYLEDTVAGRIATTRILGIGEKASRLLWLPLQFDITNVVSTYAPTPGSRQWVRLGLRNSFGPLSGGRRLAVYKLQAGNMFGAWKRHPQDRNQEGNPTAPPPDATGFRGTANVGITGSETPAGAGGQVIRFDVN